MVCQQRVICDTNGCGYPAVAYCRYPVTRRGRQVMCNRRICQRCASVNQHCPPHARIAPESLIQICTECLTASCPSGLHVCTKPGKTRLVTGAQWKTILSFGVL